MITKSERACQAFLDEVYDNAVDRGGFSHPSLARAEAMDESVAAEIAVKKLLLAIEQYRATINGLDYFGEIYSAPQELAGLIFDYDQDNVGHKASEFLRAICEEQ